MSYNRTVKLKGLALAAAVLLTLGCSKEIQSKEAVRQAVIDHLSARKGLDVGSMQIEVTSVQFRDKEADATLSFRPKGSTEPESGMQMNYTLEQQGNRWVVKSRAETGGSPHGGVEMPSSPPGETPAMPEGHPPMTAPPPAPPKK